MSLQELQMFQEFLYAFKHLYVGEKNRELLTSSLFLFFTVRLLPK